MYLLCSLRYGGGEGAGGNLRGREFTQVPLSESTKYLLERVSSTNARRVLQDTLNRPTMQRRYVRIYYIRCILRKILKMILMRSGCCNLLLDVGLYPWVGISGAGGLAISRRILYHECKVSDREIHEDFRLRYSCNSVPSGTFSSWRTTNPLGLSRKERPKWLVSPGTVGRGYVWSGQNTLVLCLV